MALLFPSAGIEAFGRLGLSESERGWFVFNLFLNRCLILLGWTICGAFSMLIAEAIPFLHHARKKLERDALS
jgi:hypothetical protein